MTYQALENHFEEIHHLGHAAAIIGWDEAAMMPVGGGEARAGAIAALEVISHQKKTDPRILEWIEKADDETLNEWQQSNLDQIKRASRLASALPEDLVRAMSESRSQCEQAWRLLRAENNWQDFAPLLEEVVRVTREEAQCRAAHANLEPYDALLDVYEPGLNSATVEKLFAPLRSAIPDLLAEVLGRQSEAAPLAGPFSVTDQNAVGIEFMKRLGFDFEHGRLDVSHHPFCGGVPDDVRITTRYSEDDFTQSLLGVLHETGHALYEQGLPKKWRKQPVGSALSMAVHESQSLFIEMQLCRSRAFVKFATPILREQLGEASSSSRSWQEDNLHKIFTQVRPDYIRVDADEVTYPMHIVLRFELEQALIAGTMDVRDVPDAWNAKMEEYLGVSTLGNDANGCMQDVHWPAGLFGYFPTYTLGAMTAAQLYAAMENKIPDAEEQVSRGEFGQIVAWLRENVHSKGCLMDQDTLMQSVTGSSLSADAFLQHLRRRYIDGER